MQTSNVTNRGNAVALILLSVIVALDLYAVTYPNTLSHALTISLICVAIPSTIYFRSILRSKVWFLYVGIIVLIQASVAIGVGLLVQQTSR